MELNGQLHTSSALSLKRELAVNKTCGPKITSGPADDGDRIPVIQTLVLLLLQWRVYVSAELSL
jgi:hypothetical protein